MTRSNDAPPPTSPADGGIETAAMAETAAMIEYNAEVLASRPGVREAFLAMLMDVPEPEEDAAAGIVSTILGAEDAADLNKPWDSDGMREHFDQVLVVHAISRRPSDYEGGLGVYLGCDCTVERTGERSFLTTGSVSAVAMLVKAHALDLLPLRVTPVKAKKATPKGYWPYHLEALVAPKPARAVVIDQAPRSADGYGVRGKPA